MAGSAQPSRQLDAVAFDYGGVLTTPLRDTIAPSSTMRTLRFADRPDGVHKASLARRELRRQAGRP